MGDTLRDSQNRMGRGTETKLTCYALKRWTSRMHQPEIASGRR